MHCAGKLPEQISVKQIGKCASSDPHKRAFTSPYFTRSAYTARSSQTSSDTRKPSSGRCSSFMLLGISLLRSPSPPESVSRRSRRPRVFCFATFLVEPIVVTQVRESGSLPSLCPALPVESDRNFLSSYFFRSGPTCVYLAGLTAEWYAISSRTLTKFPCFLTSPLVLLTTSAMLFKS